MESRAEEIANKKDKQRQKNINRYLNNKEKYQNRYRQRPRVSCVYIILKYSEEGDGFENPDIKRVVKIGYVKNTPLACRVSNVDFNGAEYAEVYRIVESKNPAKLETVAHILADEFHIKAPAKLAHKWNVNHKKDIFKMTKKECDTLIERLVKIAKKWDSAS